MIQISNIEPMILEGVRHHHERYDGDGYPDGLKGENIPSCGRILALADALDAMISHRHYRNALSLDETRLELERNAGTQFDPDMAGAAQTLMDDGWLEPYHEHRQPVTL
jgi:HD-GYP domain-containing protein (c-di-GMP phosphodiesterase class II)